MDPKDPLEPVEWHPPHLAAPVRLQRSVLQKPASNAKVAGGLGCLVLGMGALSASLALRGAPDLYGDLGLLEGMIGSYVLAPLLIVTGVIVIALSHRRRVWVIAGIVSVVTLIAGSFSAREIFRHSFASRCEALGDANACGERAKRSNGKYDRTRFEKRGCELGSVRACVAWNRDEPAATPGANEAFAAYCARTHAVFCAETRDFTTFCAARARRIGNATNERAGRSQYVNRSG